MNKKVFATIAVVAAMFAGYYTNYIQEKSEITSVALLNVEALAEGEVIVGPWYCVGEIPGCYILTNPIEDVPGVRHYF